MLNKDNEKHETKSAQRSLANSRQEETSERSEQASIIKAIKLSSDSDKRGIIYSFQKPTNKGIHLLPSTNKVYRNIKRIEFSRRMNMMDKPIVIIKFEGIIGEIHKERIWSEKSNFKLITRGGAVNGLKLFSAYFQVVLFVQKSTKNIQKIKEWTKSKGLVLDAIYSKKGEDGNIAEDFAQIYNDFNVVNPKTIAKSVIVIS